MKPPAPPAKPQSVLDDMLQDIRRRQRVIEPEVLLTELDALLRVKPSIDEISHHSDAVLSWRGRAAAVLKACDASEATKQVFIDSDINSGRTASVDKGYRNLIALLHQARHTLQMQTIGPMSAAVAKGAVFDYFDELRKIVERASSDILFVDPFLDADFVSRYLPYVPKNAQIRLLGRKGLATLLPAVDAFASQQGIKIEVRTTHELHDRYVFIDRKECFQSGASFKDGAVKAPTTLTQITDAFAAMAATYEALWAAADVQR